MTLDKFFLVKKACAKASQTSLQAHRHHKGLALPAKCDKSDRAPNKIQVAYL